MNAYNHKCAAITIGQVVAARDILDRARHRVSYDFNEECTKILNKALTETDRLVSKLNASLDRERIAEGEDDDE